MGNDSMAKDRFCHYWMLFFRITSILLILLSEINTEICELVVNKPDKQEYQCIEKGTEVTIQLQANDGLTVICDKMNDSTYQDALKSIKITPHNIRKFKLSACKIFNESFYEFFKKFNLNFVTEIDVNFSYNVTNDLKEFHFKKSDFLKRLSLDCNEISELPVSLFKNSSLTHLYMRKNHLLNIPFQLLRPLNELEKLFLSNNKITKLENISFQFNSKLKTLSLEKNGLEVISKSAFDFLFDLIHLDLSENKVSQLTDGIFDYLKGLQHINLSFNRLGGLSSGVFQKNKELQFIGLRGAFSSDVNTLPPALFFSLDQLQTVLIDSNNFTTLPENLFFRCFKLRKVSIRQNFLHKLPKLLFKDSINIESLDMALNRFETIDEAVFSNLKQLGHLNLNGNFIKTINSDFLSNFQSLTTLLICCNDLSNIDDLTLPPALKILTLDSNKFSHFKNQTIMQLRSRNISMATFHENPYDCIHFDMKFLMNFLRDEWRNVRNKLQYEHYEIVMGAVPNMEWFLNMKYLLISVSNRCALPITSGTCVLVTKLGHEKFDVEAMVPGPPLDVSVVAHSWGNGSYRWLLRWKAPPTLIPIYKYEIMWRSLTDEGLLLEMSTYISAHMDHFWLNGIKQNTDYLLGLKEVLKYEDKLIKSAEYQAVFASNEQPYKIEPAEYKDLIRNIRVLALFWVMDSLHSDVAWDPIAENTDILYTIIWSPNPTCQYYYQASYEGNVYGPLFTLYDLIPGCSYSVSVKAINENTLYSLNTTIHYEDCVKEQIVHKKTIYRYLKKKDYDLEFQYTHINVENCSLIVPITDNQNFKNSLKPPKCL